MNEVKAGAGAGFPADTDGKCPALPSHGELTCTGQVSEIKTMLWTIFIAFDIRCWSINSQTQKTCSGSQNLCFGAFSICQRT